MRMRTLSEVMEHIRENDPQTSITPWGLRRMVLEGLIPHVAVGRKRLIDIDMLDKYLSQTIQSHQKEPAYGQIRRVQ